MLCLSASSLCHYFTYIITVVLNAAHFPFRVFEETIPIEHLELFDEYVRWKKAPPFTVILQFVLHSELSPLCVFQLQGHAGGHAASEVEVSKPGTDVS